MHLVAKRGQGKLALLAAVAAGAVLVACGGGGGGGSASVQPPAPPPPVAVNGPAWLGFGGSSQHAATSQIATQDLIRIRWRTPVDLAPQYSPQGYLLVHYGSPAITSKNTVLVPVKRNATGGYTIEAHAGADGSLLWSMASDWIMPPHRWSPSFNVTLTATNRVYAAGSGGRVLYRDDADSASSTNKSIAFYGDTSYSANKATYDATVFVNTPITADSAGNIYFGFTALAGAPGGLKGGIARISADGTASFAAATTLTQDSNINKAAMNSAPALSTDEKTVYVAVNGDNGTKGYLLALDAATLVLKAKVLLLDPQTQVPASVSDDGTASPTIGTDGDVFFGVLESTYAQHNARGWLLHFDATLAQSKTPGSFGWDDTASIVPASMVPGYAGSSKYLIMTKYNNYGRAGSGDSRNKVAVLDPNGTQADTITPAVTVMKEVQTVLGLTPDPSFPGGVVEWCINTAAVDPFTKSILVNSEDGFLYRWDMATNKLTQSVQLTSGLGESYTPTAVGADGTVYAINNAVLFAVGK
ncbi:hypothetical protein GCM10027321_40320 [Massilia terrae]|uniref:SMP-30/gluconolactonase/LRE family protein n=1 Tax=Massilia terrae TaxID=1811224 RepID=A0ABT2D4K6_9BURK|nr:SMP-30/gluconolactonase/LRE family protein [Massilia terrae]MCS0661126.1 SMP-30/gluconolactonase/LRE family protein [Massilia terrae]